MSSSSRSGLATLLALALALPLVSCGKPAGRKASDEYVAKIRQGGRPGYSGYGRDSGWDNDSVIDVYVDIIAHGDRNRVRAALNLSTGHGIQKWDKRKDSRALDFMLPARIAPILLASLREDTPQWPQFRGALLLALGSIDEPTPEVVATVRRALTEDDAAASRQAVRAVGMLGFHAAEAAGDLARILDGHGSGRPVVGRGSGGRTASRLAVAGALARVSDGVHPRALDILAQAARGNNTGAASQAVMHMGALGSRAKPAADVLIGVLSDGDSSVSTVVEAIAAVSPDLLPTALATLMRRAASEDASTARSVEFELNRLVASMWWVEGTLHSPLDMRLIGPRHVPRDVAPLARWSDGTRAEALDVLLDTAQGDNDPMARRAVQYLRELGAHSAPVADDLMAILREKDPRRPPVAGAIVSISPDRLASVVSMLADLAASGDGPNATFADQELLDLSQIDDLKWSASPELLAAAPTLIAALDARPASEGAGLAGALRRIDSPDSRKAYNAFVRRERVEMRKRRSK
ncbi:hypothetical protein CMK11_17190 [Candidatus Poribacteria bacterium]|nr:hypothetical protein [Candidatus Poribacteria bacterium]